MKFHDTTKSAPCRSAKEVRRMIREASYDSLLSELGAALSVNEDVGASTEGMFDRLEGDVSDLRCSLKSNLYFGTGTGRVTILDGHKLLLN